ncbi:MAG: HIT family protein [Bacilli bacterium]
MNKDCLFCKIIKKEVPSFILYEDDDLIVILDAYPDADGHTLIIPKKHYEDILNIDNETLNKIFDKAREITTKLMKKLGKDAITFVINYGEAQVIKHFHLHLIPNYIKKEHKLSKEEVYKILTEE